MSSFSRRAPTIERADDAAREWSARLMASSEPWITLGRTLEQSRMVCSLPYAELFVARTDAGLAGFLLLFRRGLAGAPYIASVAVDPSHRSAGLGSILLDHAEALYRGECRFIFLCVSSFNTRARELYERRGYQKVGDLPDHIIDGHSELILRKRL